MIAFVEVRRVVSRTNVIIMMAVVNFIVIVVWLLMVRLFAREGDSVVMMLGVVMSIARMRYPLRTALTAPNALPRGSLGG